MKKSIGALILIVTAAVLGACNGNNTVNAPPGSGSNCGGPPSSNKLEVLYPIPGATGAPATLSNIYVATKGALPPSNLFNFYIVASNGTSTFTSQFFGVNPSKIPSPSATPSYSGATYYASSIPPSYPVSPATTYNVYWNDGGTGCTPHVLVSNFTTAQ